MRNRAFSLAEVLIITGTVALFAAIIWSVITPIAKRKGLETQVRSELRQLSVAVRLYMDDYDDAYPLSLEALKGEYPFAPITPSIKRSPFPECESGRTSYYLTRSGSILDGERTYRPRYPFDPSISPIVKAPFFCRKPGTKQLFTYLGRIDDGIETQPRPREIRLVLGARLDGSVGWFDAWEQWEEEYALRRNF